MVQLLRDLCPAHRWDAQKKWTKKEPSWHPDTLDVVLVDSGETQIITNKHGEVLRIEGVLRIEEVLPDKTL